MDAKHHHNIDEECCCLFLFIQSEYDPVFLSPVLCPIHLSCIEMKHVIEVDHHVPWGAITILACCRCQHMPLWKETWVWKSEAEPLWALERGRMFLCSCDSPPQRLYRVPQKTSDGSSCCTVTTVNRSCQLCCSGRLLRSTPSLSLDYIHVIAERAGMEKWLNASGMFKCFRVGMGSEYSL